MSRRFGWDRGGLPIDRHYIEQFLDRKPKALSGGQRQRVALGRAFVRNAEFFLLDVPLSYLDG